MTRQPRERGMLHLDFRYPNEACWVENHKGDLWMKVAGRLYDEEKVKTTFKKFLKFKTLITVLGGGILFA